MFLNSEITQLQEALTDSLNSEVIREDEELKQKEKNIYILTERSSSANNQSHSVNWLVVSFRFSVLSMSHDL